MKLFTAAERQETLDLLLDTLEADQRLEGVIVVGSASVGFDDRFSDIDLAVVVAGDMPVDGVFADWKQRIRSLLPVAASFEVRYAENSFLSGFMLDNYLELDIGFLRLNDLIAKRSRWQVAFDRSGRIEQFMQASWENHPEANLRREYEIRLHSIWHYITHVALSISRDHPWRAIHYLETIRTRTIEMACLREGRDPRHFRPVHLLPPPFLDRLARTLPQDTRQKELFRTLRRSTDLFFSECLEIDKTLGIDASSHLRASMQKYLDLMDQSSP